MNGKLIIFEGLDGSGKSTQSQLLTKILNDRGHKTFLSVKPTHYLIGGIIRSRLAGDWTCSSRCLQSLFLADHLFALEKEVIPRLEKGINVVSDRYFYSTYAYGALDCDKNWLYEISKDLPKPDLTIFLDLPVDKCLERIKNERLSTELYEKREKLVNVRDNYIESFRKFDTDYAILNADIEVNLLSKEIEKNVTSKLLLDDDLYSDCPGIHR